MKRKNERIPLRADEQPERVTERPAAMKNGEPVKPKAAPPPAAPSTDEVKDA